jgi:hypothetical protein
MIKVALFYSDTSSNLAYIVSYIVAEGHHDNCGLVELLCHFKDSYIARSPSG